MYNISVQDNSLIFKNTYCKLSHHFLFAKESSNKALQRNKQVQICGKSALSFTKPTATGAKTLQVLDRQTPVSLK